MAHESGLRTNAGKGVGQVSGSMGWQWNSFCELQLEAGLIPITMQVQTISGRDAYGNAKLYLLPIRISHVFRLYFFSDQWLIPYFGGGLDYLLYQQVWEGQKNSGDRYGWHGRGGLQFLINGLEPEAAVALYRESGIRFTYFFIEMNYSKLGDNGTVFDLGGVAIRSGVSLYFQ